MPRSYPPAAQGIRPQSQVQTPRAVFPNSSGSARSPGSDLTRVPAPGAISPASTIATQVQPDLSPSYRVGGYMDAPELPSYPPGPGVADVMKQMFNELKGVEKNALSASPGDLKSITKQHERLVLYVRGGGQYDVRLCPHQVGVELVTALRHEQVYFFDTWYDHRTPYFLSDRICYTAATMSIGGTSLKEVPSHYITPAEFPRVTHADLDNRQKKDLVDSYNHRREKPPARAYFSNVILWKDHVDREIPFCRDVWGREWVPVMANCILDLIAYNEEHPAIWG